MYTYTQKEMPVGEKEVIDIKVYDEHLDYMGSFMTEERYWDNKWMNGEISKVFNVKEKEALDASPDEIKNLKERLKEESGLSLSGINRCLKEFREASDEAWLKTEIHFAGREVSESRWIDVYKAFLFVLING